MADDVQSVFDSEPLQRARAVTENVARKLRDLVHEVRFKVSPGNDLTDEQVSFIEGLIDVRKQGTAPTHAQVSKAHSLLLKADNQDQLETLARRLDDTFDTDASKARDVAEHLERVRGFIVARVSGDDGLWKRSRQQAAEILDRGKSAITQSYEYNQLVDGFRKVALDEIQNLDQPKSAGPHRYPHYGFVRPGEGGIVQGARAGEGVFKFDFAARYEIDTLISQADAIERGEHLPYGVIIPNNYTAAQLRELKAAGQTHVGLDLATGRAVDFRPAEYLRYASEYRRGKGGRMIGRLDRQRDLNVVINLTSQERDQVAFWGFTKRFMSTDSELRWHDAGRFRTRFGQFNEITEDQQNEIIEEAKRNFRTVVADMKKSGKSGTELAQELVDTVGDVKHGATDTRLFGLPRITEIAFHLFAQDEQSARVDSVSMGNWNQIGGWVAKSKPGKNMNYAKFAQQIGRLNDAVERGEMVYGLNHRRFDLEWYQIESYIQAQHALLDEKRLRAAGKIDQADAARQAYNTLVKFSGDVDEDARFVGANGAVEAMHDAAQRRSWDLTIMGRQLLPQRRRTGELGWQLHGQVVDARMSHLKAANRGVRSYSSKAYDLTVSETSGLFGAYDDLKDGTTVATNLRMRFRDNSRGLEDLLSKAGVDDIDDLSEESIDALRRSYAKSTYRELLENGRTSRSSADLLHVLLYDDLPDAWQQMGRHEAANDSLFVREIVQAMRGILYENGEFVIRNETNAPGAWQKAMDFMRGVGLVPEGTIAHVIQPKDGTQGSASVVLDLMHLGPSGSSRSAAQTYDTGERVAELFGRSSMHFGELRDFTADMARVGDIAEEAMGPTGRKIANAIEKHGRGGLAVAALAVTGAIVGTAVVRQHKTDETWRYDDSWTMDEEKSRRQRVNTANPDMGRLSIESSNRRSNHHNMRQNRNSHLFRSQ